VVKYFPGDLSISDENERSDEEAAEETGSDDDSGNEYYSGNSSDEGGDYYEDGDSNFAFEFEEDKFLNEDIAEHIQEMAGDEDEAGFITIPHSSVRRPDVPLRWTGKKASVKHPFIQQFYATALLIPL
jgi:hypothetical protein